MFLRRLGLCNTRHLLAARERFCWRRSLPRHRVLSTSASDDNLDLVRRVVVAMENNPDICGEIGNSINQETATQLEAILANQNLDEPRRPTNYQLRMAALAASLPFFGFGILDNAFMIVLGEMFDATLCVKFGLSTMMAAALGNTFSDAIGIFSGGVVEDLAEKYGFEKPRLSRAQELMPITKSCERLGQMIGVIVGCIVGMFPLLFVQDSDIAKRDKALDEMFEQVVEKVAQILDCEGAMLLFVDQKRKELYPRSTSDRNLNAYRSPLGKGTTGHVAQTGQLLNIADLPGSEFYNPERHENYFGTGIKVRSVLCFPIYGIDPADNQHKVLGVLQVINKRGPDPGFKDKDEDVCALICSHISTSLQTTYGIEGGFSHALANCERAVNMRGVRLNVAQDRRADIIYKEVMSYCTGELDASATQLVVSDPSLQTDDLILKASDRIPDFRQRTLDMPVLGKCRNEAVTMCVNDLVHTSYYNPEIYENYKGTGINVRRILAAPVVSTDGEVLAVIASLKDEHCGSEFTPADVNFINSVAMNLALNLQGSGASLQRILKQTKPEHVQAAAEAGLMHADCSKEVRSIMGTVINLIEKAGGSVDSASIKAEVDGALRITEGFADTRLSREHFLGTSSNLSHNW